MVSIRYEEYENDFVRRERTARFSSLSELEDWIFNQCIGEYKDGIYFPNPEKDEPACEIIIKGRWTRRYEIWVHQIETNDGIVFSDGKYTNRQRHWNEEMRQKIRDMIRRQKNPSFNFA